MCCTNSISTVEILKHTIQRFAASPGYCLSPPSPRSPTGHGILVPAVASATVSNNGCLLARPLRQWHARCLAHQSLRPCKVSPHCGAWDTAKRHKMRQTEAVRAIEGLFAASEHTGQQQQHPSAAASLEERAALGHIQAACINQHCRPRQLHAFFYFRRDRQGLRLQEHSAQLCRAPTCMPCHTV